MAFDIKALLGHVQWLSDGRRLPVVAVMLVGALAVLWYRDSVMAMEYGVLVVAAAWGIAGGLALYGVLYGAWMYWLSRPSQQFQATRTPAEELAGKFEKCARDGDRRRFVKAVDQMQRLANTYATVKVYINIVETKSDDPEAIAAAAWENRDELLAVAPLAAEGALDEAQRIRPR